MDNELEPAARSRRWVKLAVIVLAVAALIAVAVMMVGGPSHGPARHFSFVDGAR